MSSKHLETLAVKALVRTMATFGAVACAPDQPTAPPSGHDPKPPQEADAGDGPPSSGVGSDQGQWELGGEVPDRGPPDDAGAPVPDSCNPQHVRIKAVVRDFEGWDGENGHRDFEHYQGQSVTPGLVEAALGADRKPVYTGACSEPGTSEACPSGQQMTSRADFDQWYRASEASLAYEVFLSLEPNAETLRFASGAFFPLDEHGFGNQSRAHNFHFTTEVHTEFQYLGGEVFTFTGDDDVWIFVNGRLAADLGGLHGEVSGVVDLDAMAEQLELTRGNTYPFDLFHAERHTDNSRFRMDTNLRFTNCGTLVPDGP